MTCRRSPTTNPALARLRLSPVRCFGPTFGTPGERPLPGAAGCCRLQQIKLHCGQEFEGNEVNLSNWVSWLQKQRRNVWSENSAGEDFQMNVFKYWHCSLQKIEAFKSAVHHLPWDYMGAQIELPSETVGRFRWRAWRKWKMGSCTTLITGRVHNTQRISWNGDGMSAPNSTTFVPWWWHASTRCETCLLSSIVTQVVLGVTCLPNPQPGSCHHLGGWGLLTLPRSFLRRTNSFVENGVLKIVASCEVCRQEVAQTICRKPLYISIWW